MNSLTIMSAICRNLHAAFPNISVYREHIDENFDEPSFFVWTSDVTTSPMMNNRFIQNHSIEISYFPHRLNTSKYQECFQIGLDLCDVMRSITVDNKPLWANNPTYHIVEDSHLQWSASFRIELFYDENKAPLMASLTNSVDFKL